MATKTCKNCGGAKFFLMETLTHEAEFDEETDKLLAKQTDNEISGIKCAKCYLPFTETEVRETEVEFI